MDIERYSHYGMSVLSSLVALALLMSSPVCAEVELIPERRKEQFQHETGYAFFPYPYSLPGLGDGWSLVGAVTNAADTYVDAYGLLFDGDVKGGAIGVADIHLIPKRLFLDVGASQISKVAVTRHSERGMRSSRNEYTILELANASALGGQLTASFYNRRLEFYTAYYTFKSKLDRILNRHGDVVVEAENPPSEKDNETIFGIDIDFTDDHNDPRKGVFLNISRYYHPRENQSSRYSIWDYSLTTYFPLGKRSTWAFNFHRSDTRGVSQGVVDRAEVESLHGLDCASAGSPDLQRLCNQTVDNIIAHNTYGTAGSLGGFNRLRSYPDGRFRGAHLRFLGSEIRWNLTDEFTPFNLYLIKDIRTAIQVSFFYEIGSVADTKDELYDINRSTYGVGLRVVTASGVVFRGDLAWGHEGFEPNLFIGYPWEL